MKSGFKNPIEVKKDKEIKSPWNFECPPYDQRTSCYVNAGTHHGVGPNQPVGHSENPKSTSPFLPKGRVNTMKTYEVPHKNLPLEIEE